MTPPSRHVSAGTNGFAIGALALGICGGAPLGLVFGVIAIAQVRRSGERGGGSPGWGIVLSAVWLIAMSIAAAVG